MESMLVWIKMVFGAIAGLASYEKELVGTTENGRIHSVGIWTQ